MEQRGSGGDYGLTKHVVIAVFLVGAVYLSFFAVLLLVGINPIVVLGLALAAAAILYIGSDKLVLKTIGAKIVTAQEEPQLHAKMVRLARLADMPKPSRVAVVETSVPNAFTMGRSKNNAVIAVTRGLMERLDEGELEAVLAHELFHVKSGDAMVLTWASPIVIVAGILMQMIFSMSVSEGFGQGVEHRELDSSIEGYTSLATGARRGPTSWREGVVFQVIVLAMYAVTLPLLLVCAIITMALNRHREYAADKGGSRLTGRPRLLRSALSKLDAAMDRLPQQDLRRVKHANAFAIVSAVKWDPVARTVTSHPQLGKRLARLEDVAYEMGDFEGDRGQPPEMVPADSSRSSWLLIVPITSVLWGLFAASAFLDPSIWDPIAALWGIILFGIPTIVLSGISVAKRFPGKVVGIIGLGLGCLNSVVYVGIMLLS